MCHRQIKSTSDTLRAPPVLPWGSTARCESQIFQSQARLWGVSREQNKSQEREEARRTASGPGLRAAGAAGGRWRGPVRSTVQTLKGVVRAGRTEVERVPEPCRRRPSVHSSSGRALS